MKKRIFLRCFLSLLLLVVSFGVLKEDVIAAPKQTVIAIDAGHGGENLGAEYNDMIEKDATLKVAKAMKEELEKYDNVTVVMTRTDDSDIAIANRVKEAAAQKPDIIISLHFNMSENHTQSGNEMWISSRDDLYQKAYRFAAIESNLLDDYGIKKRGVFVRLNSKEEDYYGIIRYASAKNIPAVIVEHCYFDNAEDEGYYETQDQLERLGKIDATAVAMTYRLKSEKLGNDYSNYKSIDVSIPDTVVLDDYTPPSTVRIALDDYDEQSGELEVYLEAYDEESSLVSYRYTLDNGMHYSEDFPWEGDGNLMFHFPIFNTTKKQKIRVYVKNAYGLESYSNTINITESLWGSPLEDTTYEVSAKESPALEAGMDMETFAINESPELLNVNQNPCLKYLLLITTPLAIACAIVIYCLDSKQRLKR